MDGGWAASSQVRRRERCVAMRGYDGEMALHQISF